jgi:hypothetical protein
MDDQTLQAMSLLMNGTQQAMVSLHKCLLNNGGLKPGQLSGAIKETFNHAEADWARLDYQFLQLLAKQLDETEASDRRP